MENEEWGPWTSHDGGPRPLKKGQVAKFRCRNGIERLWTGPGQTFDQKGNELECRPNTFKVDIWTWGERTKPYWCDAMEYQIKKPKGLKILESLIANLPVPVKVLQLTP